MPMPTGIKNTALAVKSTAISVRGAVGDRMHTLISPRTMAQLFSFGSGARTSRSVGGVDSHGSLAIASPAGMLIATAANAIANEVANSVILARDYGNNIIVGTEFSNALESGDTRRKIGEIAFDLHIFGVGALIYHPPTFVLPSFAGTGTFERAVPGSISVKDGVLTYRGADEGYGWDSNRWARQSKTADKGDYVLFTRMGSASDANTRLREFISVFNGKWTSEGQFARSLNKPRWVGRTSTLVGGKSQAEFNANLLKEYPGLPVEGGNGNSSDEDAVTRTVLWVGGGDDLKPLTNPVDGSAAHFEQLAINMFGADSGVPASRLGAVDHPTYNNSTVFEERFLRNTIAPLCRQIGDAIQTQISGLTHASGVKSIEVIQADIVHYDLERERAAEELRRTKVDTIVKATAAIRNLMAGGMSYEEAIAALPGVADIVSSSTDRAPTAAEMVQQAYHSKRQADADMRARERESKLRQQRLEQEEEEQRLMRQAIINGRAANMDEAATVVASDILIGMCDKALFPENHQNGASYGEIGAQRGA